MKVVIFLTKNWSFTHAHRYTRTKSLMEAGTLPKNKDSLKLKIIPNEEN